MDAKLAVSAALTIAARKLPYFASILLKVPFYETNQVPTMLMTRKGVMGYNPEFVSRVRPEVLAGACLHEVLHFLLRDWDRQGTRHKGLWNVCMDLEINQIVVRAGFPVDEEGIMPHHFDLPDGLLAEEYYEKLRQQMDKIEHEGCGHADDDGDGDIPTSLPPDVLAGVIDQFADAVVKTPGVFPAGIQRWALEHLGGHIPLREQIYHSVQGALGFGEYTETTYRKPSRRLAAYGIFPGPVSRTPTVAVVGDTSGSMSEKDLAEIEAAVRMLSDCDVYFIPADAKVHGVYYITDPAQIRDLLIGGGGTRMDIAISEAGELVRKQFGATIDCLVCVTDCYTNWPAEPPEYPVVVVRTSQNGWTPEWAVVVDTEGGQND